MPDVRRTIDAIWRMSSPQLIATLARTVRDVGLAEELAQDAFVAALEQWPRDGIPDNPAAWLTTTAKNKAVDLIRREHTRDAKYTAVAADLATRPPDAPDAVVDDPIGDDLLSLVFVACHPVLPREARVALTLRMVGGLSTDEIARAFLVPSATLGQRISRAKRTLTEAQVPFEVPQPDELPARLGAVLEVVYLVFNEGYTATSGEDWVRRDLAEDAMRLGRVLAGLLPAEPEVHGLVSLMELQASRFATRQGPDGAPILLEDQDRRRWDRLLITRGLAALDRAAQLRRPLGPYCLQAAIAAQHARAATWEDTDWDAIRALYDGLAQVAPSPVVALNRAVAVLMTDGPQAALDELDAVGADPRLARHHLYGAVRGDVLLRLGRRDEAASTLEQAAAHAPSTRERRLLLERAAAAGERPA
ncbi:putative RNA polymerase, sigma-24 subunit, ECF subfamily [Beutenbergia cavernae DSM 12333]|uniref:Putative RNA polymerase, sigma-24 subunit, ECF subfamily n=1 Tax=Beutenbergia cavernae (strain ATCC BAA-8 / DSM 12333 / CCUG 43141 / JCM 11478 / NBRC 16432 / NCIMB 13614 / HKI 0122) TaxID=471853 RepID=C5C444_BEUC1|nr:RNA polymerase sigma factor [Beutenbergia cavernae]ACQ79957.1 putative RNA polymerase, sigma-24 subunit, ECF subfamily [Beutenbergia cavernae DSM 12333]